MEYAFIQEEFTGNFHKSVNAYLSEGWVLYGNPIVTSNEGQINMYCQAMTRTKEQPND